MCGMCGSADCGQSHVARWSSTTGMLANSKPRLQVILTCAGVSRLCRAWQCQRTGDGRLLVWRTFGSGSGARTQVCYRLACKPKCTHNTKVIMSRTAELMCHWSWHVSVCIHITHTHTHTHMYTCTHVYTNVSNVMCRRLPGAARSDGGRGAVSRGGRRGGSGGALRRAQGRRRSAHRWRIGASQRRCSHLHHGPLYLILLLLFNLSL
jgi:hypothetical protein